MTDIVIPIQCSTCIHFLGIPPEKDKKYPRLPCTAFPDGIPEDIHSGEFDHSEPHEDDNGILYKENADLMGRNKKRKKRY